MCDRFCDFNSGVPTEISYTGAPSHPVALPAKRLESNYRFVRSKGLGNHSKVCGGRNIGAGLTSDGALGKEFLNRWQEGRFTKKHLSTVRAHVGVCEPHRLGAGKHRGYDLYWKPGVYHKRSDQVVQELDHSILNNLRYCNPLAGPMSPIPPEALQEHEFQTGCDTMNRGKACSGGFACGGGAPSTDVPKCMQGDLPQMAGFHVQ